MTDATEYVDDYPTPTPLMKRLEGLSAEVTAEMSRLKTRLARISRGLAAAEIINLVPNAVTLRWEKTTSPAYHSEESAAPELYLDVLLDVEGQEIDLDGAIDDWVRDALAYNEDNFGISLWELRDGETGTLNLLDAVAEAESL